MEEKTPRDIIGYDSETTGLVIELDRIVELYARKLGTGAEIHYYFNPGDREINPEAQAAHGLTKEFLKDKPTFEEKLPEIYEFFKDCDLMGYNIVGFDNYMMIEEFERFGYDFELASRRSADVMKYWYNKEPRTLAGCYKRFTGKEFVDAHKAESDVNATIEIFSAMCSRGEFFKSQDIGSSKFIDEVINEMVESCKVNGALDHDGKLLWHEDGSVVINFGKHEGKKFKTVLAADKQYLEWAVSDKSSISGSTKYFIKKLLKNNGVWAYGER